GALEEDPFAIYNLGYMYFFGKGVEKDIDKAIVLYKRAALLDDPFAQYNLGCILFPKSSNKVIANEKLAIEYFRKSSKNEFTPAIIKLANIYLTKSKKKNKRIYLTIALQYLEKAAQKNNIAAQYKLAMLYEKGKDVQQNKIKANFWFKEACKNNHLISCKKLMAIAAN
ncbi:MAG: TPR repeat protein, partial [Patiriisocius sp.]